MSEEFGLWKVVNGLPEKLKPSMLPLESQLEEFIESDPTLLGGKLMIIGRQVPTAHGKFIDLLAVDSDGVIHVLELKRDRTPRDVVAQVLDYGSWVAQLDGEELRSIFREYNLSHDLDTAFGEAFGESVPDELNSSHALTIVASGADPSTERIVSYLNTGFGVPINVAFFKYFEDAGQRYLARTWLVDGAAVENSAAATRKRPGATPWNGRDWYVSFGEGDSGRAWNDARKYGFVSAGGGAWYSRTLSGLPLGARIFVNIPGKGYVGAGIVTGDAQKAEEAILQLDGVHHRFDSLDLEGEYQHPGDQESDDLAEFIVPVRWLDTRQSDAAFWKPGMFANQNSACRLRNQFTIDEVSREFKVDDADV